MSTTTKLVFTGVINFGLAKFLGATLGGAIVMGLGGILWEAGNKGIPEGWRRWIGPF
jgi:hypothetical protein